MHTELCEVLVFQIKMSLHGPPQGSSWCYQRIKSFYPSWTGSSWWGGTAQLIAEGFWFFIPLLSCNSILQSSCWSDFSWDEIVARARTLHLPSSTLLPAACVSFCTLLIVRNSDSLKISPGTISSKSGCHVEPLSFKILGSILHLSLICPSQSTWPIWIAKMIYEFAALFT